MDLIYILICFLVWCILESQSQSFCGPNDKPVINVCTDQDLTKTRIIYIDTISVTDFQQTSCECVITPNTHTVQLNLQLVFMSGRNGIQFEINNISVGKFSTNDKTDITGATKLSFSTLENHANDGVCLAVYSGKSELLNISCTQSTKKETTVLTRTSSISQGSELVNISSTRATRETTIPSRTPSVSQGREEVNISSTRATRETTIPSRTPSVSQGREVVNISSTGATRETTIPSRTPSVSQGREVVNISSTGATRETTIPSRTPSVSQARELVNISSTGATRDTTIPSRTPSVSQGSTLVNISSTGATRETTIPSRTPSVSQGSTLVNISSTRATRETTLPSRTPSISQDSIIRDDINVDSITRENTIQSNKTLTSQGSQLTLYLNRSTLYASVDTQNSIESYNRLFCTHEQQLIVKVCTDDEVLNKRLMFIDTVSVPKHQRTECECLVTPLERGFTLSLKLQNISGRRNMQFQIKNITVGKYYNNTKTNVTGATKLLFSTTEDHRTEGLCLAVYSDGAYFNMTCKRSTRGTTSQSSPTSTTGVNAIIIPTVSAACGLLFGIVIAVVCVIVYQRKKKGKGRQATMIIPADANVESDYYMTENAMYNMGEICTRQPTNENEHNDVVNDAEAYAGASPSHYDCIQESTDRNQSSENSPSHAVSNEYSTCLKAGQVTAGGLNNNTSNNYQKYQLKGSRINGDDNTVYDSTKSTIPQQAVGDNDYHHLGSVGLNRLNLTYDKIGNTGVVKN